MKQSKCLQKVPGFEHLDSDSLSKVVDCMELEHHEDQSKTIFNQGDKADCLYVIMKGTVEVFIHVDGEEDKKVREMGELEFFGENGLSDENDSRGATVQSKMAGRCSLLKLTRSSFKKLQRSGIITEKVTDLLEEQKQKYAAEDYRRNSLDSNSLSQQNIAPPKPPPPMKQDMV